MRKISGRQIIAAGLYNGVYEVRYGELYEVNSYGDCEFLNIHTVTYTVDTVPNSVLNFIYGSL